MDKSLYEKYDSVKIEYGDSTYTYLGELTNYKQDFILPYTAVLPFKQKDVIKYDLTPKNLELPIKKIKITAFKGNEKYVKEFDVPKYGVGDNIPPFIYDNIPLVSSKTGNIYLMGNGAKDYFAIDQISEIADDVIVYIVKTKKEWEFINSVDSINITKEEILETSIYNTTISHKSYITQQHGINDNQYHRHLWNVEIPSDLEAGRYVICISVKDTDENEAFKPIAFYNRAVINSKPEVTVNSSKPTINYTINSCDINASQKYSCSLEAEYFDESDGKWKHFKDSTSYYYYYGNPVKKEDHEKEFSVELSRFVDEKFIRVSLSEVVLQGVGSTTTNAVELNSYYPINYTKPLYFLNSSSKSNVGYITQDITGKFWLNGTEQKCLFSTVYSKDNLGNDADIWEMYTKDEQHLNTKIISAGEFYEPDYNHVPENCYYTVIVHYSDGKTEMATVKQK